MSMHFRELADKAATGGIISPEDIFVLRREGWADGTIRPDEAEAIFVINDHLTAVGPDWSDFFVEALGEFIVNGVEPKGYVSDDQARWLMERIDGDGRLKSLTELELLVRLFERALNVPQALREYALAQIERAVLTGEGPTRDGGSLEKGNVTEAEARLMRRIIFSSASDRPAAVSRKEAELLYRIKDATLGAENAREWEQLFVQGVGNYLAGFSSYQALTSERAAELEAFMGDNSSSLRGFVMKMGKSMARDSFFDSVATVFGRSGDRPDPFEGASEARKIDTAEQTWLEGRIDANGQVDALDQALLDFLEEESGFRR